MRVLVDLILVTAAVWIAVFLVHNFDLPQAIEVWNVSHEQWAIDELTMIAIVVVGALGVFAWRRWRESLNTITRHEVTLQELRITEAQRGRLIASVSHELRTPLTALLGYAELLGNSDAGAIDTEATVSQIIFQGWDLAHIVDDLLTQTRTEAGSLTVVSVPVLLGAQTAQVIEGLDPEHLEHLRFDRSTPVRAIADPARVRQIIRNLVTNAIRHGGPNIVITIGQAAGMAQLEVCDDGPEILPEEREHIFETYHRLTHAHTSPGGLGLGLSISRKLARLMSGDLFYRRRGTQSVFLLSLPLALENTHPRPEETTGGRL